LVLATPSKIVTKRHINRKFLQKAVSVQVANLKAGISMDKMVRGTQIMLEHDFAQRRQLC
jgi:hypothetical protein